MLLLKGKHGSPPSFDDFETYDPFANDDQTSPTRDYVITNIWYGISDDDHYHVNDPFENDFVSYPW